MQSRDVRWDAPEPMPETAFSADSSNSGTSIDLSEFSGTSEHYCDPLPPKPSQPNAAKSQSGQPTECLRIISNVYERSYPMRPIDVCVLQVCAMRITTKPTPPDPAITIFHLLPCQDSFSCTGGTKVVWEISVLHDKVPQLRGHNRAEVGRYAVGWVETVCVLS